MTYIAPEPFAWNYCGTCGSALIIAYDGQSDKPHCSACRRFYYHNPVPAACAFIARRPGELLFAQRAVEPCYGEWSLPGGFIEINETPAQAVIREVREETNLLAKRARLLGVSARPSPTSGAVMVLGYVIEEWEGEADMRPESDALALEFFPRSSWPPLAFMVHRELLELYIADQGL